MKSPSRLLLTRSLGRDPFVKVDPLVPHCRGGRRRPLLRRHPFRRERRGAAQRLDPLCAAGDLSAPRRARREAGHRRQHLGPGGEDRPGPAGRSLSGIPVNTGPQEPAGRAQGRFGGGQGSRRPLRTYRHDQRRRHGDGLSRPGSEDEPDGRRQDPVWRSTRAIPGFYGALRSRGDRAAARLSSSILRIVPVENKSRSYLVMEYLKGRRSPS